MLRLGFHRDGFARGIWAGRLLIMIAVGLRTELLGAFCVMFSLFSLARVLDLCGMSEQFNTWIFFFFCLSFKALCNCVSPNLSLILMILETNSSSFSYVSLLTVSKETHLIALYGMLCPPPCLSKLYLCLSKSSCFHQFISSMKPALTSDRSLLQRPLTQRRLHNLVFYCLLTGKVP